MIAKLIWTVEIDYPIDLSNKDDVKRYLEERHCQENILDYLIKNSEDGVCKLCAMGKVEVIEVLENLK